MGFLTRQLGWRILVFRADANGGIYFGEFFLIDRKSVEWRYVVLEILRLVRGCSAVAFYRSLSISLCNAFEVGVYAKQ